MSAYKSCKSVKVIQFRTSTNYVKLTESKNIRYQLIILTETERPLNVSISLSMSFAAETHRAKGSFNIYSQNSTTSSL
jgi:hypothetical protein